MVFDKALGKAVKNTRLSKALTQEFFSDITSRSHYSRIEGGQYSPTVAYVNKLAQAMDVHPLTILTMAYLNNDEELNFHDLQKIVQAELFQINKSLTTPEA